MAVRDVGYHSYLSRDNGGRVLCVTALGSSVEEAQARAYEAVQSIHWQDAYYRRDIGRRAIDR